MADEEPLGQNTVQFAMRKRLVLSLFGPSKDDIKLYRLLMLLRSLHRARQKRREKLGSDIEELQKEICINADDLQELKEIAVEKKLGVKLVAGIKKALSNSKN